MDALEAGSHVSDSTDVLFEELVDVGLLLLLGDLSGSRAGSLDGRRVSYGTDAITGAILVDSLLFGLSGFTLDGLTTTEGEEHELAQIGLKALNVGGETLFAEILSASIDTDTDSAGILGLETSSFEFINAESTTKALLHIVSDGGTCNLGAEGTDWAREYILGLNHTEATSADFAERLVKEDLDVTLL